MQAIGWRLSFGSVRPRSTTLPERNIETNSQKGATQMKIARLVGLTLVAILAVSAVVASAASANAEFKVLPTSSAFTGTGGTGSLIAGNEKVECTANTTAGTITSMDKVGKVTVDFTGCKLVNTKGTCTIKSVGSSTEGLIITNALSGLLGTVASSEAKSQVGLLLKPETSPFVKLAATPAPCSSPETSVLGSIAGEVETTSKSQTTGKLNFTVSSGNQAIKTITTLEGSKKPELEAFGVLATEATEDVIKFASNTEIV
jgi:hypothetical protein